MAVRRVAPPEFQPKAFAFTAENLAWAQQQVKKYPEGRQQSAIIPLLWRAPGFAHLSGMDFMCRGRMLPGVSAVLGLLDILFREVDR